MVAFDKCALCQKRARLLKSHLIPKFAVEWLKNSSVTGYLRSAHSPNIRVQDAHRVKLLCASCENVFSKAEKFFAKQIFYPYHKSRRQSFEYKEWLLNFAVSLAWRTGINELATFRERRVDLGRLLVEALERWKRFLLADSKDPGPYDHHVFFLDYIQQSRNLPLPEDKLNAYFMRSVDLTLGVSSRTVFVYTKLPGVLFWTGVLPPKPEGWDGTLISPSGTIRSPQSVSQPGFADFLLSMAKLAIESMSGMSDRQRERITQTALRNPQRVMESEEFRAYLAGKLGQT